MSTKDYRPWERPRLIGRCASCGQRCALTGYGLCDTCAHIATRGTTAWAPAFQSPVAGGKPELDGPISSLPAVVRPTGSAGAGNFTDEPSQSRDVW